MSWFQRAPGRPLTRGESEIASAMFGPALDVDAIRLHGATWWPFQPRNVAMAPDGHIWFPPDGGLWRDDFSVAHLHLRALFVHELTHVWQAQKGGRFYLLLARHPFCKYRYTLKEGRSFGRYGLEQQAEIVRHVFMLRSGEIVPGAPPLNQLEKILPFDSERCGTS